MLTNSVYYLFCEDKVIALKGAFRVNSTIDKKLARRKRKITKRTARRNWSDRLHPMLASGNIHYDVDGRRQATAYGGIGSIHQVAIGTGLVDEIDRRLHLLKRHLPYHESDHVLNLAFNHLAGGTCLQDIDLLRNDEAWLNALGAGIIPDPTTAGDFLRRFDQQAILELMEAKNNVRQNIWRSQPASFLAQAIINVDGTICPTCGQCKQGMDISYDGQWGYHPLIVSLANTREPLYIVNRPGNAPSHLQSAQWIDRSLDLVGRCFKDVQLRGDTDFSLTANFDRWDERCTFIFGMDAHKNLVKMAAEVAEAQWEPLEKSPGYRVKTHPRRRPENVKAQVVRRRQFKKVRTEREHVVHLTYQPGKCHKSYRLIILRKTLKVVRGEMDLFDEVRYFFYITNDWKRSTAEMVAFYRDRSDHENDIEQLKSGVRALVPASDTLVSNWALMVAVSLAWDLKAWCGLLMPYRQLGLSILRMEFKRFIRQFVHIPCLIIRTGRRLCYRLLGYNDQVKHVIKLCAKMRTFSFP
jgi:hypothetical protein